MKNLTLNSRTAGVMADLIESDSQHWPFFGDPPDSMAAEELVAELRESGSIVLTVVDD